MTGLIRMPAIQSRDPFVMVPGGPRIPWPPDGFDPGGQRALAFAQAEAARLNHNHVGPTHLLVGVLGDPEGLAARVLAELGIDRDRVRDALGTTFGRGETPIAPEDITLIPSARRIIEMAMHEARRMRHPVAGSEHLLVALVRDSWQMMPGFLESLGVDPADLLRSLLARLELPLAYGTAEDATPTRGPYKRFHDRAQRALALALEEALTGSKFLGDLQLLLGIARLADVPGDPLGVVFGELKLTTNALRVEIEKLNPPRDKIVAPDDIKFTAGTKLTIELAINDAGTEGPVRPEHILHAMFSGPENMAGYVLRQLGVSRDQLRAAIGGAQAA